MVFLLNIKGKQLRKFIGHNGRVNGICYGANENVIVCKIFLNIYLDKL